MNNNKQLSLWTYKLLSFGRPRKFPKRFYPPYIDNVESPLPMNIKRTLIYENYKHSLFVIWENDFAFYAVSGCAHHLEPYRFWISKLFYDVYKRFPINDYENETYNRKRRDEFISKSKENADIASTFIDRYTKDMLFFLMLKGHLQIIPDPMLDRKYILFKTRTSCDNGEHEFFCYIVWKKLFWSESPVVEPFSRVVNVELMWLTCARFRALRAANAIRVIKSCFKSQQPVGLFILQAYLQYEPTYELSNEHELMTIIKWAMGGARIIPRINPRADYVSPDALKMHFLSTFDNVQNKFKKKRKCQE